MSAATEKPHGVLALIALLATVSGIATCHLVLAELRTAAEQHKIRRLALAGLVIGYLSIAVYIVMTLLPGGTLS